MSEAWVQLWEIIAQHYDTNGEIVIRSDLRIENKRITHGNNFM
jgi:hypothetical protein